MKCPSEAATLGRYVTFLIWAKLTLQRWVFKDYLSQHSDLRWHKNLSPRLTSAWKLVFMPAKVRSPTEIIFTKPTSSPMFSSSYLMAGFWWWWPPAAAADDDDGQCCWWSLLSLWRLSALWLLSSGCFDLEPPSLTPPLLDFSPLWSLLSKKNFSWLFLRLGSSACLRACSRSADVRLAWKETSATDFLLSLCRQASELIVQN